MSAGYPIENNALRASSLLHLDVTGTVDVTNSDVVYKAVLGIYQELYPEADHSILNTLFTDFSRLYRGEFPGFMACETPYHDVQHVLDVTLATARLIHGYQLAQVANNQSSNLLSVDLAHLAIALALFHDSGYIRRKGDVRHHHGAEYTRTHVSRSALFLKHYLSTIGRRDWTSLASKLVHFTGYEKLPEAIAVTDPLHRMIGKIVGTADVIAQMADRDYLRKCRDYLFLEFKLGGMTYSQDRWGNKTIIYSSPEHLLKKTPEFIDHTLNERLTIQFDGLFHLMERHFSGKNWYLESIVRNRNHLENLLINDDEQILNHENLRAF